MSSEGQLLTHPAMKVRFRVEPVFSHPYSPSSASLQHLQPDQHNLIALLWYAVDMSCVGVFCCGRRLFKTAAGLVWDRGQGSWEGRCMLVAGVFMLDVPGSC